ncbi:MAG: ATP-binding protein [Thermodesulfobacteriota bacterium]|nr:ATP-binding protein [Thermodesulfobacteriota bacterium]
MSPMENCETILNALIRISEISNDRKTDFTDKLKAILHEVTTCMNTESGSIMLLKGRKKLEVAASTKEGIEGITQPLEGGSPAAWVINNNKLLYMNEETDRNDIKKGHREYKKSAFLIVPVRDGDKPIGVISVTEKVDTDRFSSQEQEMLLHIAGSMISAIQNNRLNDSLRKTKDALKTKNRQLKKLERMKTELFNMLIHDLKGPISEIIANLDIMTYTIQDEENLEYVETAQSGCDTLFRMISDLLDIARMEDGSLKLMKSRIDAEDVVKEAVSRLWGMSRAREVTLTKVIPTTETLPAATGDSAYLLRVLQNLITNAISYSPAGETVEVGVNPTDEGGLAFFVKDNGPGVPAEYRDTIFDKFMQVEKKNDGRLYTTGLGLTFCKLAVEAHGGTIRVESDGQSGSRFIFELPPA